MTAPSERLSKCLGMNGKLGHRISIVGPSGSGKSYLAQKVAQLAEIPLHSLDELRSGLGDKTDARFQAAVTEFVRSEKWVIDGHYRSVRDKIWREAETIILLDLPLPICLLNQAKRKLRARNSVAKSCSKERALQQPTAQSSTCQRWSRRFNRLAKMLRENGEYRRLLSTEDYAHTDLYILQTSKAVDEFLKELARRGNNDIAVPADAALAKPVE